MNIREKLQGLGLDLPEPAAAAANYVPYTVHDKTIYVAGQVPFIDGVPHFKGRLGADVNLETGQKAARVCALNILAQVDHAVQGDWSQVQACLKLGGFVSCTPDFTDQPKVINGASDLIVSVMGEAGRHARFAVGAPSLPLGVCVEIDALFALKS